MQAAFLVTLKTGKFLADLLLGKGIELAVSSGGEVGVAVYTLVSSIWVWVGDTDFMRASVRTFALLRYNLMTLGLSMRTGVSSQLPNMSRVLRLMIMTSSLRSTLCLLN